MHISIIIPGIRTQNWVQIYNDISKSCKKFTWEIIFVGPYDLPTELKNKNNIQYFKDWGCPTRCRQIAFRHMKGDYMCYGADDTFFIEDKLDDAFKLVCQKDYKTVLIGKYLESSNPSPDMYDDKYYKASHHFSSMFYRWPEQIKNYYLILSGLISKQLLYEVGGWDTQFQACAMAGIDLGFRLQNLNINTIIGTEPIFHATHCPGTTGDHAPIHYATLEDMKLLDLIYSAPNSLNRIRVDLNNWMLSPEIWKKRFS